MKKVLGYTLSQRWSKPYNFDLSFRTLQFVVDHDGLRRGRSHKPPPNQTHQQQRFCWYMKYTYLIISKRNLNFHSGPLLLKSFENYYIKNSNATFIIPQYCSMHGITTLNMRFEKVFILHVILLMWFSASRVSGFLRIAGL